jgi:recombination protein RecA
MTSREEFYAKLNPKVAKGLRTAAEVHTELLPIHSYGLNKALGGGIGKKRIALFYGNTSSGKSALLQQSVGDWQRAGQVVAYIDVEGTWDNKWSERLGVNNKELILVQKRSVSKIYNEIRPMLEAGIDAVVIDSISMALPDSFINEDGLAKDLEHHKQIGAKAKALTTLINGIHYSNENAAVALISQTTTNIQPTYTQQIPDGGKKVGFATSQIVKLTSSGTDKAQIKGDIHVGNKTIQIPIGRKVEAYVEKNKIAPQGKSCEYNFYYDGPEVGIDITGEVIEEAVTFGVVEKAGSWIKYGGEQWQGQAKLVAHVKENPGMLEDIKKDVEAVLNG